MKIYNNTQNGIFYDTHVSSGGGDCGTIEAQQTLEIGWDETDNVTLHFTALPPEPQGGVTPYTVTIPQSETGMTVTIGLYQE